MSSGILESNLLSSHFIPKISSPGFAEIMDYSTELLYGFRRYVDGKCFALMALEVFEVAEQLNQYIDGQDVILGATAFNILEQLELCWNDWTLLFRGTLWPVDEGRKLTTRELSHLYPVEQSKSVDAMGFEEQYP